MAVLRPRKTIEDYMSLPEGVRAELIDGEIFMSPSPKYRHQQIQKRLSRLLDDFVTSQALGEICVPPLDVHLLSGDVVQPDIIFVAAANRGIVQEWIRGVPDLLVEIVSPEGAERDRIVKRDLYARNGVREYWLVDDATRSVEILTLSQGRYAPYGFFEEGDCATSVVLPGLALPVRDLFD
jgi:Uma2 family endonuclease